MTSPVSAARGANWAQAPERAFGSPLPSQGAGRCGTSSCGTRRTRRVSADGGPHDTRPTSMNQTGSRAGWAPRVRVLSDGLTVCKEACCGVLGKSGGPGLKAWDAWALRALPYSGRARREGGRFSPPAVAAGILTSGVPPGGRGAPPAPSRRTAPRPWTCALGFRTLRLCKASFDDGRGSASRSSRSPSRRHRQRTRGAAAGSRHACYHAGVEQATRRGDA